MADNPQEQNPSQGQDITALLNRIQQQKKYNPDYFGQPLPDLNEEDFGHSSMVKTLLAPGGGSLPYTSIVEGANTAQFPLMAWYKSKGMQQANRQRQVAEFYKKFQEPEGFATYQPRVDKFWNEQVMGHMDNYLIPKYGQDAYRIAEGDVRNPKEAKDYQDWTQRFQYANNLADHSNLLGKTLQEMNTAEEQGKYVDPRFKEKMALFGSLGQDLHKVDFADDIRYMNDTYSSFKILPAYVDTIDKLAKNPQLRTLIGNAYMSNGGQIPDALELDKITAPSHDQLDNWSATMFQNGYISPLDPNPGKTDSPESIRERQAYIARDILNAAANKVDSELKMKREGQTNVSVNLGEELKTGYRSAPSTIQFGENNKYEQNIQYHTPLNIKQIAIGRTLDAIGGNGKSGAAKTIDNANINGIVLLHVKPEGKGVRMLTDDEFTGESADENAFVAPFVQASIAKKDFYTQEDVNKKLVTKDKIGKPIPDEEKEYETVYIPLNEAASDLQEYTVNQKAGVVAMQKTIDQYNNLADRANLHASKSAKDYYKSHFAQTNVEQVKPVKKTPYVY